MFDSGARIVADTSILCGLAVGDLKLSRIPPKDRTTAAGQFHLRAGMDLNGGNVLMSNFFLRRKESLVESALHEITMIPGEFFWRQSLKN